MTKKRKSKVSVPDEPYTVEKLVDDLVMVRFKEILDKEKSAEISEAIRQVKVETRILPSAEAGKIIGFIVKQDNLQNILRLYG